MAYTGANRQFQIGKEVTYGTGVTPTEVLNVSAFSMNLDIEKKATEVLMNGISAYEMDIVKKGVSGSATVVLKPENAPELFYLMFGSEADPVLASGTTYKHVFTPVASDGVLPFFSVVSDFGASVMRYKGCKIDGWKINLKQGETAQLELTIKGQDEESGTLATLTYPTKGNFKFAGGSLTFDGSDFGNVTGITLEGKNNTLDRSPTLATGGITSPEPPHGMREYTISVDSDFDASSATIRENKYKGNANTAIILTFYSESLIEAGSKHRVVISLPLVCVTSANPSLNGTGIISMAISGTALASPSTAPISVEVYNAENKKAFVS